MVGDAPRERRGLLRVPGRGRGRVEGREEEREGGRSGGGLRVWEGERFQGGHLEEGKGKGHPGRRERWGTGAVGGGSTGVQRGATGFKGSRGFRGLGFDPDSTNHFREEGGTQFSTHAAAHSLTHRYHHFLTHARHVS